MALLSVKTDIGNYGLAGRAREQILGAGSSTVALQWRGLEGWCMSHDSMDMTPAIALDHFVPHIPFPLYAVTAPQNSSDGRETKGAKAPGHIHTEET